MLLVDPSVEAREVMVSQLLSRMEGRSLFELMWNCGLLGSRYRRVSCIFAHLLCFDD